MHILIERVEAAWKKGNDIAEILKGLQLTELFEQFKAHLLKVEQVIEQSRSKHIAKEAVAAKDRIFSIFEDHTELLKREKLVNQLNSDILLLWDKQRKSSGTLVCY